MAKFDTLADNFNDNIINASLWEVSTDGGLSISEKNEKLVGEAGGGESGFAIYRSKAYYDLTNSSVTVKLTETSTSNDVFASFTVVHDTAGSFSFYQWRSNLQMYFNSPDHSAQLTIPLNSTNHRWLRIRHASGTVYWDTSPDGEVWTNRYNRALTIAITAMKLELGVIAYGGQSSTETISYDNLGRTTSIYSVTSGASGGGEATLAGEWAAMSISSGASGGGMASFLTQFQALPQKDYEYRIFDSSGNYIGTWANEVTSDFKYEQSINQNASELSVHLARSPENRITKLEALTDELGAQILDNNSDPIYVQTTTANAVGPDTDVQENFNVDVFAFYGGYESLLDENGDPITDENGSTILVQFGAPNGKRVYSGYIVDYELTFGSGAGVDIVIAPHTTDLYHHMFTDALGNTTVGYLNADPVQMARDAMDRAIAEGSLITYTASTMPLTGESIDYDFKVQRVRQAIDKSVELLGSAYYHLPDPGENIQYLLPFSQTTQHTFYNEKHLSQVKLKKSISQLVNDVPFIGGVPEGSPEGTPPLYIRNQDAASQSSYRRGLEILTDSRVTDITTAQALSQSKMDEFKNPRYRTTIRVTDAVYDIETIKPGHMVAFANFGSFIDDLMLRVVTLKREKHAVVCDLDMFVPNEGKRLEDIKISILSEQVKYIPSMPS